MARAPSAPRERQRPPSAADFWLLVSILGLGVGLMAATQQRVLHALLGSALISWLICCGLFRCMERQRHGDVLRRLAEWGLVLRALFVIAHLVVAFWFYGGMTDLTGYMRDVETSFEEILGGRFPLPLMWELAGEHIGAFSVLAILTAMSVATGPTLWALFALSAVISMVGAYLYFRAFQRLYPDSEGEMFMVCVLFFLPAVGFYSTLVGKDFIVFFVMGWVTYALAGLVQRTNVADAIGLGVSGGVLYAMRAHVAIPVFIAIGLAIAAKQITARGEPPLRRLGAVIALACLIPFASAVGLTELGFQQITAEAIAERAQVMHVGFATSEAGSALPLLIEDPSPASVIKFLPLGLFTVVFRPFIWEAHNLLALVAGAENLLIVGLMVWRRRQLVGSLAHAGRHPLLLYCLIAFLGVGAIISLEWNLGTMARHKTMVMPYLMMLLAGTRSRAEARGHRRSLDGQLGYRA